MIVRLNLGDLVMNQKVNKVKKDCRKMTKQEMSKEIEKHKRLYNNFMNNYKKNLEESKKYKYEAKIDREMATISKNRIQYLENKLKK